MEKAILQSIIEITRQRDLDSLEYSLVATIAELLPTTAISIYKLLHEHVSDGMEEILCLTISDDEKGKKSFDWNPKSVPLNPEPAVNQYLLQGQSASYQPNETTHRLLIPLTCDKELLGVIRIDSLHPLDTHQSSIEGLIRIYENYQALLNESERDKLTHLLNRRTFERKLGRLLKSQQNHQEGYAAAKKGLECRDVPPGSNAWLAMVDIDHFKKVNDNYGHLFGDEVLLRLAQLMRKCFRNTDLLFRFGGEEFVIILEPVPFDSALFALERFRKMVEVYEFPQLGCITVSIGFEKITVGDFPDTVLELADKALYFAKEQGRNRTYNYRQLVESGSLNEQRIDSDIDLF